jgi:hypothetical protein
MAPPVALTDFLANLRVAKDYPRSILHISEHQKHLDAYEKHFNNQRHELFDDGTERNTCLLIRDYGGDDKGT